MASQISIENLDEGDELGDYETPECCDTSMNEGQERFECGRCGSVVTIDGDRTITHLQFA